VWDLGIRIQSCGFKLQVPSYLGQSWVLSGAIRYARGLVLWVRVWGLDSQPPSAFRFAQPQFRPPSRFGV
jgi:hypothetical protein